MFFITSQNTFAQATDQSSSSKIGPKKQLTMIFLAGLSGAVLGLSTLSFYGKPQQHLGNIAIGFAIGAVFGTIFVTYNTATKPKEYLSEFQNPTYMNPTSRANLDFRSAPTFATYTFTF